MTAAKAPSDVAAMPDTLLAGFFGSREIGRKMEARRHRVHAIRSPRCDGFEYLQLAAGETHFSLFTKLMPWGHAARVIVQGEAGGHSAYLESGAYHPGQINRSRLLLTPDAASWRSLHALLSAE